MLMGIVMRVSRAGMAILTRGPALEDGIEWTVKLSEVEAPHIVQRFQGAFDSLWCDEEFEQFRPDDEEFCRRVKLSLEDARSAPGRKESGPPVFFDLRPHPYQQATLDQLESERTDKGHFRNLVVAPTGTGKTLIAAFDYARQPYSGKRPRLLFLAHREELLQQARSRFRHVLRDESFGDLLGGGAEPSGFSHLFATIQSFRSRALLESQGAEYWEYVVLDEAHHVPAQDYREIVASLRPRILLGLSELARYAPDRLAKHFEGRYNWLLSEFIAVAPLQFVDAISAEMTGSECMPPGRAS